MLIPPKYTLTQKIVELLQSIEGSREVINSIQIPPEVEANIRRRSTLKSSLFSARIEGNTIDLDEISRLPSQDQRKVEVYNILKALNWIHQRAARDLTIKDVLNLHELALNSLIEKQNLGSFRTNFEAIFNSAGIAIYLPPRPVQVPPLLNRLLKYANSPKEPFIPIRACIAHYTFEKVHPFLDGNGRVGRLFLQAVLAKGGYGMKSLTSIEEYLDSHRSEYYRSLEEPEKDISDYLEFMLRALAQTAEEARTQVLTKQKAEIEDTLLPRRAEILNIVKDHKLVGFDQIRRRFPKINERTLRYDLKKLADSGFIKKRGTTKGVYYGPSDNA
ncbi:MAG: hypothetical protein A3D24_01210 [Candidatus Blackburnbacteria bacterium RIFCSPHIGHO2_02_FULL_39_13]|uniref:Fido domain-containing protein n=1 Tax=Candidatus Blackburnbacteria bacterium RIFCSPLOWO2_01_FULL_40_20 TaxID=1797519 RepID=A0A1G1VFR0_9BACT|nr:MAG: hypothetical protein A2694_04390 [Candidatus Blackburnbacteria bacterium RIFCSPHIGHO2_01_FULL_40_17]OGY08078.1 MAG: hypothetical protein A3D24_01210 [Candidatus Blackburnbacteria bacterium RIFCSPHIGHO2_02_FULL_39_13]OGY14167.1 MAG: hypothetical protein A3A77_04890 [Candidatus Blackburnbacteria bacterium RIFCSPLOWO2_01_FULL_40_20]OGY15463.1 MAG: hypothetical protein A3I52_02015 [Candidatus Blackburnbacteria bacterium RIFCSPLOWO2_02_FULL_40_10]